MKKNKPTTEQSFQNCKTSPVTSHVAHFVFQGALFTASYWTPARVITDKAKKNDQSRIFRSTFAAELSNLYGSRTEYVSEKTQQKHRRSGVYEMGCENPG